jgi:hypothetical protein
LAYRVKVEQENKREIKGKDLVRKKGLEQEGLAFLFY